MEAITKVIPLKNNKIEVVFNDNVCYVIDISPFINSTGMSQALTDEAFFNNVKVDEAGGVTWNNGFDFCPVFLRQIAVNSNKIP